jgi:uncharacterized membrane protein (TIGR02234 family)
MTDAPARDRVRQALASRSGYAATILVGVAGAGGCALAVSRPWVRGTAEIAGLPPVEASVSGADIAPLSAALAVVSLAAFGAVIATRGWPRRALGIVIIVCAAVVVVSAIAPGATSALLEDALAAKGWTGGEYDRSATGWRLLAALAGSCVLLTGAVVARFAGEWATMGTRYDSPAEAKTARPVDDEALTDAAMWRSLDDGGDPTQGA